tara:strand:+ start:2112 stop:3074 length:963 start_codon:yes stop_codon:yes gene_type:complete
MHHRPFTILLIFINIALCNINSDWKVDTGYDNDRNKRYILLSNSSTNEERIISERITGEFRIYCDGSSLKLLIDWGLFANESLGNVYYYIRDYGFWEENWEMSRNGRISYSEHPFLLLSQLITSDSLAIGIRPKYSNEIRFYFNNSGLIDIIYKNKEIFSTYSDKFKQVFDAYNTTPEKQDLKNVFGDYISREMDLRELKVSLSKKDRFIFSPFWFESKLDHLKPYYIAGENIFYFNKWLKKKGTLFTTDKLIVTKLFKKEPTVIPYKEIKKVELKGNDLIGYRILINDKYLTHFSKIEKNKITELKNFIVSRSLNEKSS